MKNFLPSIILILLISVKVNAANDSYLTLRKLILNIEKYGISHSSRGEILCTLFNGLSTSYDLGFKAECSESIIQINSDSSYLFQLKTDEDILTVLGFIDQYRNKIKSTLKYYRINMNLERYFCDFLISRIDKVRNSRVIDDKKKGKITNREYDFEYQINDENEYEVSWVRNSNCAINDSNSIESGNRIQSINSIPAKFLSNSIVDSLFFENDSAEINYLSDKGLLHKTFKSHSKQKDIPYTFSQISTKVTNIKIFHFLEEDLTLKIAQDLSKHKYEQIIIDLRNNTGGYIQEISRFIGLFLKVQDTIAIVNSSDKTLNEIITYPTKRFIKPELLILINSSTASGANIIVGMLRKGRNAIVIGENSYMENSIHTSMVLSPNMSYANLMIGKWLIRTKADKAKNVIYPDFFVPECINENGDNILDYALNFKKQN